MKFNVSWDEVHKCAHKLALQMYQSGWRPDYIVGINPNGLPLSVILANLLDVRHYTLDPFEESNCWMAEDAFGYVYIDDRDKVFGEAKSDPSAKKNILVVDHINVDGKAINWVKDDWQSCCLPDNPNWDTIWGQNVRFATMYDSWGAVDYYYKDLGDDETVVFPWEYD
jgi:hypoxanthine phosphoribosyltransferase